MEIPEVKTSEVNTIETSAQAERDRIIGSMKGSSSRLPEVKITKDSQSRLFCASNISPEYLDVGAVFLEST